MNWAKILQEVPVPAEIEVEALAAREAMLEAIVETDDDLMAHYLEDRGNFRRMICESALRKATIAGIIQPVLCGSSLRNKGCSASYWMRLWSYLPSPLDIPPVTG